MKKPVQKVCKNCHYWLLRTDGRGLCVRYPPRAVTKVANPIHPQEVWPETTEMDWCGEWKLREGKPPGYFEP